METITGKTIIFTDQHFGVKGNSPLRQRIGALAIKSILDYISHNNVKNIIFAGDYFHQRNSLTIDTLNIAHKCLQALAKKCKVYMILGNHDLFNKNSTDVNSISIFQDIQNIEVIDKSYQCSINGKNAILVPWLGDLSNYNSNEFDIMIGHFEIATKFLISNYSQEHSKHVTGHINDINEINTLITSESSKDLPGNFIDLVKPNGVIFAGHIHQRKEMRIKNRHFIFVGCPYQQNLGDINCKCGFYVLDENCNYIFNEITSTPKHIQFKCSDILKYGIDNYDFSSAKNNIVQKIYDVDVSLQDDLKINQKISSYTPYEELLPDYRVEIKFDSTTQEADKTSLVSMLKKSKLDYIKSYIDQLDNNALKNEGIEKDKLFSIMKHHYTLVAEG